VLVVATVNIAAAVIGALFIAAAVALGDWLGKRFGRLTRPPGQRGVSLRQALSRNREQLRNELTPGERRFLYSYTLMGIVLPPVAIGLLVFGSGAARGAGIGLILLALVVMAVPISPFLRARVRRRERDASEGE
jgi:hypothetical protein